MSAASTPRLSRRNQPDLGLIRLREQLAAQVTACCATTRYLPLGTWLARDVVLACFDQAGEVISRAAQYAGLPETTFARRLRQAQTDARIAPPPESWADVRDALCALLAQPPMRPHLDAQIGRLLLDIVADTSCPLHAAASMMGLSVPTFKRRLEERALLARSA